MKLREFHERAQETVNIPWKNEHGADVPLLGILGEVGSVATVLKKWQRDDGAYTTFERDLVEELGDVLWYVAVTAYRLNVVINFEPKVANNIDVIGTFYKLSSNVVLLIKERQNLRSVAMEAEGTLQLLFHEIVVDIHNIAAAFGSSIGILADQNYKKTRTYWGGDKGSPSRQFDAGFPYYEILPRKYSIDFIDVNDGNALIIQFNGVNIGDRLTDNSFHDDGYRFHDVFHLSNAATLGWSPVLRRMLHRKRKSNPLVDEVQDGARAATIEELVVNHVYDYARDNNFLEGVDRVDFNLIKTIRSLVRGYEVEQCDPWEWSHCVIEGCRIFRELCQNQGGRVSVDSGRRFLDYEHLS